MNRKLSSLPCLPSFGLLFTNSVYLSAWEKYNKIDKKLVKLVNSLRYNTLFIYRKKGLGK